MTNSKKNLDFKNLSDHELATLIDEGSEGAAIHVCHRLVEYLYAGTPIPYEFQFRLSLGLNRFICERQCADLLNSNIGITWLLSNRRFKTRPDGKKTYIPPKPKKNVGRKHVDSDELIKIFFSVKSAWTKLGRLKDSRFGNGAFSAVAEEYSISPGTVEARYYAAKKILDKTLTKANEATDTN